MSRFPNSKKVIKELRQQATQLEGEMKHEAKEIKKSSAKALGISLMVAAGGLTAALVYKMLSEKREEEVPSTLVFEKELPVSRVVPAKEESVVLSRIKSAVVALLIEAAKNKLTEIINRKFDDPKPSK